MGAYNPAVTAILVCLGSALLIVLTVAGCDSPSSRLGVHGTVNLDGQSLEDGLIGFVPQPGTVGPSAGSEVLEGKYRIGSDKGLLPGSYRVEISGWRKTGRKKKDFMGNEDDELEPVVPRRYNERTKLTADVTSDGSNEFEFDLSSK